MDRLCLVVSNSWAVKMIHHLLTNISSAVNGCRQKLIFGWAIPLTNTLNINKDILSCLQRFLQFLVLLDQNERLKFDRKHEAFSESISLQKSCYICRSGVNTQAHQLTKGLRRGLANVTSTNTMLLREIRLWFLFYKAFVCLLQMYAVHVQGHMSNKVERCKRVTSIFHWLMVGTEESSSHEGTFSFICICSPDF